MVLASLEENCAHPVTDLVMEPNCLGSVVDLTIAERPRTHHVSGDPKTVVKRPILLSHVTVGVIVKVEELLVPGQCFGVGGVLFVFVDRDRPRNKISAVLRLKERVVSWTRDALLVLVKLG